MLQNGIQVRKVVRKPVGSVAMGCATEPSKIGCNYPPARGQGVDDELKRSPRIGPAMQVIKQRRILIAPFVQAIFDPSYGQGTGSHRYCWLVYFGITHFDFFLPSTKHS